MIFCTLHLVFWLSVFEVTLIICSSSNKATHKKNTLSNPFQCVLAYVFLLGGRGIITITSLWYTCLLSLYCSKGAVIDSQSHTPGIIPEVSQFHSAARVHATFYFVLAMAWVCSVLLDACGLLLVKIGKTMVSFLCLGFCIVRCGVLCSSV